MTFLRLSLSVSLNCRPTWRNEGKALMPQNIQGFNQLFMMPVLVSRPFPWPCQDGNNLFQAFIFLVILQHFFIFWFPINQELTS